MQTGINGLTKGQEGQKEFQKQTILVLTEIRDSLKDRGTDHILFSDKLITNTIQLQKNTVSVAKLSEAVVRISFALEGIEKSMNRKPWDFEENELGLLYCKLLEEKTELRFNLSKNERGNDGILVKLA